MSDLISRKITEDHVAIQANEQIRKLQTGEIIILVTNKKKFYVFFIKVYGIFVVLLRDYI